MYPRCWPLSSIVCGFMPRRALTLVCAGIKLLLGQRTCPDGNREHVSLLLSILHRKAYRHKSSFTAGSLRATDHVVLTQLVPSPALHLQSCWFLLLELPAIQPGNLI